MEKEDVKTITRHFDVVAEDLKDNIKILAEQVAANTEKLEEHDQRFDKIDQRFDEVSADLNIIKLDMETMKNDLIQKVSRNEFSILEKRVSMLESKI
jgi:nitrate/nitrite-specific signal transduction histidine kinase